jgi:hypothetical protein
MNDTKLATSITAHTNAPQAEAAPERTTNDVRLLEDFELVLAGGGDGDLNWP